MKYFTIFKLGVISKYGIGNYLLCKCCIKKVENDSSNVKNRIIKKIRKPEQVANTKQLSPQAINKMSQGASGII